MSEDMTNNADDIAITAPPSGGSDLDDLSPAAAEEGRTLEIRNKIGEVMRHPDGRPFTVTLLGTESKLFRDLVQKQNEARSEIFFRTRRPASAKLVERDGLTLLVRMIKSWDITLKGEKVPSNEKSYRDVLEKYPTLRAQIDDFIGNTANFTKG